MYINKKMINLYIVDYNGFHHSRGGIATYGSQLATGLVQNEYIKLHYIWINSKNKKNFTSTTEENIVNYYIPGAISKPNNSNYDIKVADYLSDQMKNKQNIVIHFNWVNHCPFAHLLKERIRCKTVLTKHCIPWRDFITNHYLVFTRINKLFLEGNPLSICSPTLLKEQISYLAMDSIICVTAQAKQSLVKLFHYPEDNIHVVYNGIHHSELAIMNTPKIDLRKKYGFDLDEKILLFVGAIRDRKGSHDLAKTFDKLVTEYPNKKLRLVFAGKGDHNKLLDNIKHNWSKITITGGLKKSELYDFYAMADIGIVPSYVEQCSYTAIEMMTMGLPIIVADVDGLKEIVPDSCGLKVKLKLGVKSAKIDTKDLCSKLIYFIENKSIAEGYGIRAKTYALKEFSAKRMIEQTIEIYKNLFTEVSISSNNIQTSVIEEQPVVSVILPCYNAETYIGDCLESILSQTWKSFELIIIDDGSTDNTASIIKNHDDSRIKYIKNKKNRGIVYSLNKGISLAKGKYMARMDADDIMHKNRLEKQVLFMENHPNIALVGSWHYIIDESKKIIGLKQYFTKNEEIKLILPFENPFSHPSIMLRLEVAKSIGYSQSYSYCEDYDLWIKIASKNKVANIPECLTYYRVHPSNNLREYTQTQKQSTLELQSDIMDEWGINPTVEELLIHAKISTNQSKQHFTSEEKINALTIWINKVLTYQQKQYNYPTSLVNKMRDYLIYDYCGVNPIVASDI